MFLQQFYPLIQSSKWFLSPQKAKNREYLKGDRKPITLFLSSKLCFLCFLYLAMGILELKLTDVYEFYESWLIFKQRNL